MIKSTQKEEVEIKKVTVETVAGTVVGDLKIEDSMRNKFNIRANYGSFKKGKDAYQTNNQAEVVYLRVSGDYPRESACIGLSIEDAEAIVEALQSVIDYTKN